MQTWILVGTLLLLFAMGYVYGRKRAVASADGRLALLHSVPSYYGLYVGLWTFVPAILLLVAWVALEPMIADTMVLSAMSNETIANWVEIERSIPATSELLDRILAQGLDALNQSQVDLLVVGIHNVAAGGEFVRADVQRLLADAAAHYSSIRALGGWLLLAVGLGLACLGLYATQRQLSPDFRARNRVERMINVFLIICSSIAILTTLGILLSLIFESLLFFAEVPVTEFLFGTQWSPQIAIREDQVGSSGAFGAVPLFAGTLMIAFVAMLVAVPIGLLSAIYLAEYAPGRVRGSVKPILEILAGVPTVVYGFFAILTVAPFFRDLGAALGLDVDANSALAAGAVMGIMIIPFVSSLSDDVINSVPQSLRDGSAALGATKSETVRKVIFPAALPGIVGAILLAVSRAIGETMIVVMAAGLQGNLTWNPLEAMTTVTVQITSNLTGDTAFDDPKTLSAFGLGLTLFVVTLCLNVIALRIVKKYREKYD
jgi:phosphate transport system permease protein